VLGTLSAVLINAFYNGMQSAAKAMRLAARTAHGAE
jgi:hypothetical protein